MSVPVTTRLDDATVAALDRAVAAGTAPSRAAAVAQAIHEWLQSHDEDAIVASYRSAYAEEDPAHDELVARLGEFSAATVTTGPPER